MTIIKCLKGYPCPLCTDSGTCMSAERCISSVEVELEEVADDIFSKDLEGYCAKLLRNGVV